MTTSHAKQCVKLMHVRLAATPIIWTQPHGICSEAANIDDFAKCETELNFTRSSGAIRRCCRKDMRRAESWTVGSSGVESKSLNIQSVYNISWPVHSRINAERPMLLLNAAWSSTTVVVSALQCGSCPLEVVCSTRNISHITEAWRVKLPLDQSTFCNLQFQVDDPEGHLK